MMCDRLFGESGEPDMCSALVAPSLGMETDSVDSAKRAAGHKRGTGFLMEGFPATFYHIIALWIASH